MTKQKETAFTDFWYMIKHSWTFDRMTIEERERLKECIYSAPVEAACVGSYDQRYRVLHAVYDAFLVGLGYDGHYWREPETVPDFKEQARRTREEYLRKQCNPHPFIGHPHF